MGEAFWCAGAPTREGNDGYIGRILCLNFDGEVLDSLSAQSAYGLGQWIALKEGSGGDRLLVSEPLWSGEGGLLSGEPLGEERENAGRVSVLKFNAGELQVEREYIGAQSDQQIGERVIGVGDGNDDGIDDLLMTGYADNSAGERQVWLVNGNSNTEVSRLKRFSAADTTAGSFGASLAYGRFDRKGEQGVIAFGTPFIESSREGEVDLLSRLYSTTLEGESLGTNSARIIEGEEYGIGESMTTLTVGRHDLLVTAGPGLMRVLELVDGKAEVLQEF